MAIESVVDAIIDIINKNIIAKSNVISNIISGSNVISVENSFQFSPDQEIVLIDWGYNQEGSTHYQIFEYAKVKEVNNTTSITLTDPVVGNWLTTDNAFVQKTIGHSPLYENNVFYGDREVIPFDQMAIAVEPSSLSNEWIYIQGGLSEDYKVKILIYGKDIKFEEGRRILDRYSDAVYELLNNNIHLEVNNYHTPLVSNYAAYSNTVTIADTTENREEIVVTSSNLYPYDYQLQDNNGATCFFSITNLAYGAGTMILTINVAFANDYKVSDYAILKKWDRPMYIYDSRVDAATFGQVSKGSAFLRASELSWFGKRVNEHDFPQRSNRV